MNPVINIPGAAQGSEAFGVIAIVWLVGIAVAFFWMVVGWRAMRAHEKLAAAAEEISRRTML